MSINNQSRSLIIISKAQGWDPTKVDGFDLSKTDVPSAVDNHIEPGKYGIGALPDPHQMDWPDGEYQYHPQVKVDPNFKTPWEGEDKINMTSSIQRRNSPTSDPYAGMGGRKGGV